MTTTDNPNQAGVVAAARRLVDLVDSGEYGLFVRHPLCQRAFEALVKVAAEESDIVKAARVLTRAECDRSAALGSDPDMDNLMGAVALVGPAPYEQGIGTDAEDDWVAPLRAELTKRYHP